MENQKSGYIIGHLYKRCLVFRDVSCVGCKTLSSWPWRLSQMSCVVKGMLNVATETCPLTHSGADFICRPGWTTVPTCWLKRHTHKESGFYLRAARLSV